MTRKMRTIYLTDKEAADFNNAARIMAKKEGRKVEYIKAELINKFSKKVLSSNTK